jgi:hypothetical protein
MAAVIAIGTAAASTAADSTGVRHGTAVAEAGTVADMVADIAAGTAAVGTMAAVIITKS